MGTVEAAEVATPMDDMANSVPMSLGGLVPQHLSPIQQSQLTQLLEQCQDIFSQDDDDIGQTPDLEHTTETQGLPMQLPCHQQNTTVPAKSAG